MPAVIACRWGALSAIEAEPRAQRVPGQSPGTSEAQLFLPRARVRRAGRAPRYFCSGLTISETLALLLPRATLSNSVGAPRAAIFFPMPLISIVGSSCPHHGPWCVSDRQVWHAFRTASMPLNAESRERSDGLRREVRVLWPAALVPVSSAELSLSNCSWRGSRTVQD